MFVRLKKNKSGMTSVQVISKPGGKYRVVKTIGCDSDPQQINKLRELGQQWISQQMGLQSLELGFEPDKIVLDFISNGLEHIRPAGADLVLNLLFDEIGFNVVPEEMFRYLVLCRLVYPGSKLRTTEYLARHHGIFVDVEAVYRFMDRFSKNYKTKVEQASFEHTCKILGGTPSVVFYDVTTLYFEASREDDFRQTGFSKDGKAQNPQIVLGLLVASMGYPLAYSMFEGSKYEGHTMIPVIEAFKKDFKLEKLIVVADAGLMSASNIKQLIAEGYDFILGARLKAETKTVKSQVLDMGLTHGQSATITRPDGHRLIVNHTDQRAKQDVRNRTKGLEKLEQAIQAGKLNKEHINNRGYNKFLKLDGKLKVELNKDKVKEDQKWDGLKGYLTNTNLPDQEVVENYRQLWNIEKAFRMSKTDLKFRPIFHRKKSRIETHLCIAFCSYKLYKELERQLQEAKSDVSPERAVAILNSVYELQLKLPRSGKRMTKLIVRSEEQKHLLNIFNIPF